MPDLQHVPPDFFRQMLQTIVPGITVHLSEGILEIWFPPGAAGGVIDDVASATAEVFAAEFGCGFSYLSEQREGVFYKLPPD